METDEKSRLQWWKDAKFGMFIHWGLYALPAKGEWAMYAARTPVAEYEQLAKQFNPVKFSAKEWVNLAKTAGMKYLVITAKHHDGFAMFHSQVEKFNIVDATPFQRDPIKELAEECKKQEIKLCFYYSHVIDWHHPHSIHEYYNNTWEYQLEDKAFYRYWNQVAKPQVKELLTEYGPIGLMWFDTAGGLSKKDSREMVDLVHNLQPDCLVNSRVSHWPGMGDYQSKGDNEIPMYAEDTKPWETPMTLNKSWGYRSQDQDWKKTESIIYKLVNIVSKGGNLLLDVGPTAEGLIPEQSTKRLLEIGDWINRNSEAIYETDPSPFPYEFDWGAITVKHGKVYLHLYHKYCSKTELVLCGLKCKVAKAYFLANGIPLEINQSYQKEGDHHELRILLPSELPDQYVSVMALELDEQLEVDESFIQQASGTIKLDLVHADIDLNKQQATWDFKVVNPGTFEVVLVNFKREGVDWAEEGGKKHVVKVNGQRLEVNPKEDHILEESQSCQYPYREVNSTLGRIKLHRDTFTLSLISDTVREKPQFTEIWQAEAVKLRAIKLIPVI